MEVFPGFRVYQRRKKSCCFGASLFDLWSALRGARGQAAKAALLKLCPYAHHPPRVAKYTSQVLVKIRRDVKASSSPTHRLLLVLADCHNITFF